MSRQVDKLPTPASVRPMKVIGLGPSRTGTLGLYTALKMLGYKPFHISELLPYNFHGMSVLQEAITSNSSNDESFSRPEFEKMWADYDCIIESPCYLCPNVVDAYLQDPEVKFILTVRSPESFVKSLSASLCDYYTRIGRFPLCLTKYFDGLIWHLHGLFGAMTMRWSQGLQPSDPLFKQRIQESYTEYLDQVQTVVPQDRLLVLSLEQGFGWEEICSFLGHKVPDEPYPRVNSIQDFHVLAEMIVGPSVRKTWIGLTSTAVVTVGLGVWYLRKMRVL